MLQHYDLDISEVFIHKNFVISQIKDGLHLEPEHVQVLQTIIDQHYVKRKLVYISNRVNSYSVNPLCYKSLVTMKNLAAIAIVTSSEHGLKTANFEMDFYGRPSAVFSSLTGAIDWAEKQIEIANKKE